MRLGVFLKIVVVVTLLALCYIHIQMEIINLAYQGKVKEKQIEQFVEGNGNISHLILKMKSANNIGVKMLTDTSDMQFVDPNDIVHILTPQELLEEGIPSEKQKTEKKSDLLLGLLSFGNHAEARDGR